jgi:hypothetical protein
MAAFADIQSMPVRPAASLAVGERVLPVADALTPLFPEGGLVRGLALVARSIVEGRWLAIVGCDDLSAEALVESGIPLRRVVSASPGRSLIDAAGAVLDGFEVVIIDAALIAHSAVHRIAQRVRSRDAVVVLVGAASGGVQTDIAFTTHDPAWEGIGWGTGRLVARRVRVERAGRRTPRPITRDLWLPAQHSAIDVEEVTAAASRLRMV